LPSSTIRRIPATRENQTMKRLLAIIPLGIALIVASCNQAPPPGNPKILEQMSIAWDEALNTKDLETLTMLYASDARILPPERQDAKRRGRRS
jgi:hypothetical protein